VPNYAEWVSTLALLLGAGSLAWQVAKARREQPIISVDGQWSVTRVGHQNWDEGAWSLPVHVTNAGGRAVTVVAVYWELVGPEGSFRAASTDMGSNAADAAGGAERRLVGGANPDPWDDVGGPDCPPCRGRRARERRRGRPRGSRHSRCAGHGNRSLTGNTPAASRWSIRPAAISVMNIAAVLIVIRLIIG
jgi:hypothetical protein